MNVNADVIAIEVTFAEKQPGSAEGLRQTLLRTPVLSEVFSSLAPLRLKSSGSVTLSGIDDLQGASQKTIF